MKALFWIGVLFVTTGFGVAGPLERSIVSANAIWVAHLDVDAFKQTTVGQHVLAEMEKPEVRNKLAAFQAIFSIDPLKDVQSLTLYGTGTKPEDGVLIVQGNLDTTQLLTLLKGAKDYASGKYRGHVIHEWTDEKKQQQGRKDAHTVAAVQNDHLVIFGQTRQTVRAALDVLDKVTPNLNSTVYFDELTASGGSFAQAATRKIEIPDGQPHSAMLRQAKYMSLVIGETAGQMAVRLLARANSNEAAQNMQKVGQGLLALMSFQTNNPTSAALAKALNLQQSGTQLTATLNLPGNEVIQWLQNEQASKVQK